MDKTCGEGKIMKRGTTKRHINNNKQQNSPSSSSSLPRFKAIHKSKKEKVKSLSAVAKALSSNYQMGCNLSDSHKSNPSKRFKLPKKVFNECNGVDHASVPRKIRSAMKKRGRESILTDSEKLNHKFDGIESHQKDRIKKSKKQVVLGPITKDEEEVAETLYALAGMFPTNDGSNGESELECESLPKKSSVSQDQKESTDTTFQASEAIQDVNVIAESSSMGEAKNSLLSETISGEQTDFRGSPDFLVAETHNTVPKMNLQGVPMMVKRSENDVEVELHDSKLSLEMGLNVSDQSQILQIGGKLDMEYKTDGGIDCKRDHHKMKYQRENEGSALWSGLTPRASSTINASYLQSSSAAKAPHWLSAAICNSKYDLMGSCSSGGKVSKAVVHKKSWKSCAAHVHISQLIRSLEDPKRQVAKEPELNECHKIRVHQGSKFGVQIEAQNTNGTRNTNGFAARTVHSSSLEIFPETKNGILQQPCHYHDTSQSQAPPKPAIYGPQKQSSNFLSLSVGSNSLKVDECFNKGGSRLEPFSKSQVPYFRSIQQQHGLMPIPTTPSQYTSTSYLDQLPAAGPQVRLQQPHYYGTPLCGTNYSSTISYKQQYQNFWAAQLVAAQGGSGVNSNVLRAQYPNWQSGRHETCAVNPGSQVILPHHSFGSKMTSISDQQPFSSIPLSRTNGLEESRGRFHGSSASSLQLLCDERI